MVLLRGRCGKQMGMARAHKFRNAAGSELGNKDDSTVIGWHHDKGIA